MSMQQIVSGQANAEVPANENFQTLEWASVYGRRHADTTGLSWGYYGGVWGGFTVTDGTLTLTNGSTNYVVVSRATGVISVSTTATNWDDTANYARVYRLTVAGGVVTVPEDFRGGEGGLFAGATGGSGGSGLRGLLFTADTGSTSNTDPGNGLFRWNHATQASATQLFVDNQTDDGVSVASYFAKVQPGGFIYLQQASNPAIWQMWRLEAVSAASGYYRFTVSLLAKTTANIADDAEVFCEFRSGRIETWAFACSDLTTALTTGAGKGYIHAPYAAFVIEVQAGLATAQTSGSIFTVDINEAGSTILSTKITIDNTEDHSSTAATPAVISDGSIAKGAKITADIDQIGDGTAKGLTVYLLVVPQ